MVCSVSTSAASSDVSFSQLGEIVENSGLLTDVSVSVAREWVGAIKQCGPKRYDPKAVDAVLDALSVRVASIRGVKVELVRAFVALRRGAALKGSGGGRYRPRGIESTRSWLLATLASSEHGIDDDTTAVDVCRRVNIPPQCAVLLQVWWSFTKTVPAEDAGCMSDKLLWVLMGFVGAVLSPASHPDVSQELAYQLFVEASAPLRSLENSIPLP